MPSSSKTLVASVAAAAMLLSLWWPVAALVAAPPEGKTVAAPDNKPPTASSDNKPATTAPDAKPATAPAPDDVGPPRPGTEPPAKAARPPNPLRVPSPQDDGPPAPVPPPPEPSTAPSAGTAGSPSSDAATTPARPSGPTVFNAGDGFAFTLPAGWGLEDPADQPAAGAMVPAKKGIKFGPETSLRSPLQFLWQPGEPAVTAEFIKAHAAREAAGYGEGRHQILDASIIRLADRDCGNIELVADVGGGRKVRQRMVMIPGGGKFYAMLFTSLETDFAEESKVFGPILASLSVPAPKGPPEGATTLTWTDRFAKIVVYALLAAAILLLARVFLRGNSAPPPAAPPGT